MNLAAVRHRNTENYILPRGRRTLTLSLETARADMDAVTLYYWPRYEAEADRRTAVAMTRSFRDATLDHYRAEIRTEGISAYTRYGFLLEKGDEKIWLGKNGFTADGDGDNFFEFLWPNPTDSSPAPEWAAEQVYYQIFPERFCCGDAALTPAGAAAWGSRPDRECFMGGDLRGIRQRLDYIASLGVTCLYLTPIFKAPSNHKYDTEDYFSVDPAFGTEEDLRSLVEDVHRRGMRILLDGVFNHCGYRFPPFQDVVKNGESSRYKRWFFPHSFPVDEKYENYDCVGHYKWMPKINLADPEAREYFLSVGRYWVEHFDIDGWRLDVADEVPSRFWIYFSDAIRAVRPDVLLLGETWADAGRLLSADRLDSAMNYLFRDVAADWLARGKLRPSGLDDRLNRMLALYPYDTALRLYNPLDSHDTERFRWLCADGRLHELAVVLQMTFPGCPAVFYGDEVGLSGGNDPLCRLAMEWEEERQDQALLALYRRLIGLRRASPSLLRGDFRTLVCDDEANAYAFARRFGTESTVILLNAGGRPVTEKINADGEWTPLLGGKNPVSSEDGSLYLTAMPYSAEIYQRK